MKRKTNISIQDNRGVRVTANMIVGEQYQGFSSGDFLDANAVIQLVKELIQQEVIAIATGLDNITSANITDGTIQMNDLSDEVIRKINSEYDENDEALSVSSPDNND